MIETDWRSFWIIGRQLEVEKEKAIFVRGFLSTFDHNRVEILKEN